MLKKRLSYLKQELGSFCYKEKKFTLFAMATIFCISLEYSITRPASTSLFLHFYGAAAFPYVWLCTVPVNLATVSIYNYILPRFGCVRTWILIASITILVNTSTLFLLDTFHLYSFIQFLWKDIYILLMYKQIWSLIHSSVTQSRAKYLYGFLYAMGGIAATIGGIIPGFFATFIGSRFLFLFTLPIYSILCFCYVKAYKSSNFNFTLRKDQPLFPGFKSSNYIIYTLLLVIFMQVSIAFVEYKFNLSLEKAIGDVDLRTEYAGKVLTVIHSVEMILQLIGGIVLINFFGLKNIHYFIPITLFVNALLFIFVPSLYFASYLFIYIKSLDFSIFGIVKEMLYIPMKVEEKFKAKALIDVFALRSAKALAGFFVLLLGIFKSPESITSFSLVIFVLWIIVVKNIFKSDLAYDF